MQEDNSFSRHLTFNALKPGFERLKDFLASEQQKGGPLLIGFEATGHYWLTLFEKLKQDGFTVYVLNPLQVQSFRNQKIRGSKTDDDDCELIAKVLKFGVGRETELPNETLFKLKQLSRFRTDIVRQVSSIKLRIMAVLDIVFPEYGTVFLNLFGVASTKVLEEYATPDAIAEVDVEKLTEVLEEASRKRVSKKTGKKIAANCTGDFRTQIRH